MRRLLIGLLCALAAFPAAAQAAAPELTEVAGARFPERAYALALPEPRPLTAADVEVLENGKPVEGVTVAPGDGAAARSFGVVLAIDTSHSMRGRPLQAAVAAARDFVRHRRPDQPVGLVTFDGTIDVVTPPITDGAALDRALAGVREGGRGSRIADAASRSVELIAAAGMPSASVVVISDGADYHSQTSLDVVAAAARDAHAHIYGVGLGSRYADFGSLNLLAAKTGGEFSAANSLADLSRVYRRLGSRLAHQYVIHYRSTSPPARRVRVEVQVHGIDGASVTSYRAPAVPHTVGRPFHHVPAERLWASPAAMVAIGVVVALLVFGGLRLVLRPRRGGLRERVSSYVDPPEETSHGAGSALTARMLGGAERSLDGRGWWDRFQVALDVGRVTIAPVRVLAWVAAGTLAALLLFALIGGSPVYGLLALAVPVVAWRVIGRRVTRQRKQFVDQLPDSLQMIASAMRAGHSFSGALTVVVEDSPEPTRRELRRVIADERLGVPLDVAMGSAVQRMDSKDLEQVALVAALQRETGGNTAEVIDRVTEAVRQRLALRRMIASLTAQGRMSRWVLTGIPIFLLVALTVLNPTYMEPLFATAIGRVLLVVCAVMITAGSLVIKRIVDIKA